MADDKDVLDWVSPRKQREIDNQSGISALSAGA